MDRKTMTCIACPRGCRMEVTVSNRKTGENIEESIDVKGNLCSKGRDYAVRETVRPMRVLTSTVATSGSVKTRLPVKTDREIPREAIPGAMKEIFKIIIENSVIPGDLISKNLGGTGADLISTGVWDGR